MTGEAVLAVPTQAEMQALVLASHEAAIDHVVRPCAQTRNEVVALTQRLTVAIAAIYIELERRKK